MSVDEVMPIVITIGNQKNPPERLSGFAFFWCKYVVGFDQKVHCAQCLLGHWATGFGSAMTIPARHVMDAHPEASYIYLCGVDRPGGNFGLHIAMEHAPGQRILTMTWNGIPIVIEHARQLYIPPLPPNYQGYPHRYTSCMNWRFGMAYLTGCSIPTSQDMPPDSDSPIIQHRLL